jgi:hypothetical protein
LTPATKKSAVIAARNATFPGRVKRVGVIMGFGKNMAFMSLVFWLGLVVFLKVGGASPALRN